MKTKTYSENEILDVLAQVEAGVSIREVARQSGVVGPPCTALRRATAA